MPLYYFSFIFFAVLLLVMPTAARAVDIYNQFFGNHPSAAVAGGTLGYLFSTLLPNLIIVAGVLFLFLIVYGGFLLIIYGGQYNPPARVAQSKNMITYGAIGFLLVVSAYFILQIISTLTGINFINAPIF